MTLTPGADSNEDQTPRSARRESKRGVTKKGARRVQRSDAVSSLTKRHADAKRDLPDPPIPLPNKALPYWNALMVSRMWEEWTDAELVIAARLARVQADLTDLQVQGDKIPMVVKGKTHPVHLLIHKLLQREITFLRGLKIAGTVKTGTSEGVLSKSRAQEKHERERLAAKAKILENGGEDEDGLLAG